MKPALDLPMQDYAPLERAAIAVEHLDGPEADRKAREVLEAERRRGEQGGFEW